MCGTFWVEWETLHICLIMWENITEYVILYNNEMFH